MTVQKSRHNPRNMAQFAIGMLCAATLAGGVLAEGGKPAAMNEGPAAIVDPEQRRVILRVAPGIDAFKDVQGGTWFLPGWKPVDGFQAGIAQSIRNVLQESGATDISRVFDLADSNPELAELHRLHRDFVVVLVSGQGNNLNLSAIVT